VESLFLTQPRKKPMRGIIVVAVGDGKKDEPITVKVGDTVLYGKYAGTELSVDGNRLSHHE
jgi:chaperonin GroES